MKKNYTFLSILLLLLVVSSQISVKSEEIQSETKLTIYTYDSLLDDPGYDFIGAFANHSGILKEEINLVLLSDANQIVTQMALEKDSPVADVAIGIDNVLIHSAKRDNLLTPYISPELANISSDLIDNLDSEKFVLPYDFGIIALYYDMNRINSTTNPEITNITLEEIIEFDLDKKLIVEDPTLSSPGLGFLLWTIAIYGDPTINFNGTLGLDWRDWWKTTKDDLRIAPSWTAAFGEWYEGEENRPIMVSYGTSPAYSACQYNDTSQGAFLSHENGTQNGWLQIEGIGLVNNAPHEDLAKNFIDWFLSKELQDNIAENNWMYPANDYAEISTRFNESSINPDDVNILNSLISSETIGTNLEMWKGDWETIISSDLNISGYSSIFFIFASIGAIAYIQKKIKRN
ncbi:thiamine ABC transporter substrate binding subunit [Promethearchaeum syntrophicum]|uniref:Thiamine ABC transporter substrate binding subunit n=1 Tax=Promethearchaeum syntrophicum TaxID=2594042 RepID=A0A5B9DFH5_9ARCH|nr:thiamine ABC transporter substrate-binding protein [Candidatus Prometheoarchaeum syntrophicum]QEE18038.1 thiamine transporter substrate binding subunit [Candidatus Prometheoarchaeum syntrophicum]